MSELFTQLGINIPSLIAQGVNFLVVLVVLYYVLYKPLLGVVAEREQTITKGLSDASEAARALADAERVKAAKISEAENTALSMIQAAEVDARGEGERVLATMHAKAEKLLRDAKLVAEHERIASLEQVHAEAANFVRALFEKTVALAPEAVDEQLIREAAKCACHRTSMRYKASDYAVAFADVIEGTRTGEARERDSEAIARQFAALLAKHGEIAHASHIIAMCETELAHRDGGREVTLEYARDSAREGGRALASHFSTKDFIRESVNPWLVAGVRITIDGAHELDLSLAGKLKRLFAPITH